jgi:serine protease Do
MQPKVFSRTLIAAAVVAALGGGYFARDFVQTSHAQTGAAPAAATAATAATAARPANQPAGLPDVARLVREYGPAVVHIAVDAAAPATPAMPRSPRGENDPFAELFKHFRMPMPEGGMPRQGLGSGFIVSADGFIMTNAHVVANATDVTVKLADRRELKAKVVGADARTDVALLKIEATGLPTVKLGDPKSVQPGEWVAAIGSPFGLENSVTAGVVSATGRALPDSSYVPFIQTDVAVNPGNSGGPLFNMAGEVIGINSQIFSRTGGYQGVSFAIPIDVALSVKDQLATNGRVVRGRLGVGIQEMTQPLAASFGMKAAAGALVSTVEKASPAEAAGLKAGDVVLKLDGKPIERSGDLARRIAETKPGSKATLEIWREGATKALAVTVGEAKDAQAAAAQAEPRAVAAQGKLGVAVRPLSAEERKSIGGKDGVMVEGAAGAAEKAGIRAGDVILAVNGTPVKSVEELRGLVGGAAKSIAVLVQREDAQLYVPVNLG